MPSDDRSDITMILSRLRQGDRAAEDALIRRIYAELNIIARLLMLKERSEHTLQPTALVHEAFLRLRPNLKDIVNRRVLFSAARRAMREVLIDHARRRMAKKRTPSTRSDEAIPGPFEDIHLDIAEALEILEGIEPHLRDLVECRFYLGLTVPETAEQLGVSAGQVEKDWRLARAWLHRHLGIEPSRAQVGA